MKDAIDDLRNCEQGKRSYTSMVNRLEKQRVPLIRVSKILVYFIYQLHENLLQNRGIPQKYFLVRVLFNNIFLSESCLIKFCGINLCSPSKTSKNQKAKIKLLF